MPKEVDLTRNQRQQGGPSVQVWGTLLPGPYLFLLRINQRMDSTQFMNFFELDILPHLTTCTDGQFILQQDQAPAHVSAYSRRKFADLGVELLPWPSRSPDLNIIENVWSMLARIVYDNRQYANSDDLWSAIDAAATEININQREALESLFKSIPKRLLACVELKGALTKY